MGYKPGQSGNPSGRPKGLKDRRTALRDMLAPHANALVARCVEMAMAGDPTAMRLCVDRLMAPVREHPLRIEVPPIESADDCVTAQAAVIASVAAGETLPGEAQALSSLIEAQRRAYETSELAKRLLALEQQFGQTTGSP